MNSTWYNGQVDFYKQWIISNNFKQMYDIEDIYKCCAIISDLYSIVCKEIIQNILYASTTSN
jgi:hypothetical protein